MFEFLHIHFLQGNHYRHLDEGYDDMPGEILYLAILFFPIGNVLTYIVTMFIQGGCFWSLEF